MLNKYKELNDDAREYFLMQLTNKIKDNEILKRCKKEINLLYDNGILFILEYIHKYKEYEKKVNLHFKGTANNLLILYIFGLSKVNPIKYGLPNEFFQENTLRVDFVDGCSLDFVSFLEKYAANFRIVKGSFTPTDVDEINEYEDKHYLLIPCYVQPKNMTFRLNEFNQFETIEDYNSFKNEYITIKLDDKPLILKKEVNLKYALHTEFEEEIANILNPNTIEDYIKIISMSHGTNVWKNNQDKMFKSKKSNIKNLISDQEDVYEYLIKHKIEKKTALKITTFIKKGKVARNKQDFYNEWKKYKKIMLKHKCDNWFIKICSKIEYLYGRGEAIDECLFALDKTNYYSEDD